MGYRSSIVVALHKNIMARNLVTNELPDILKKVPYEQSDSAFYWKLEWYKWYSEYPEIAQIEAYFKKLDAEVTKLEEDGAYELDQKTSLYGAIRLAEEDANDTEEWGYPEAFDIQLSSYIDSPVGSIY